MKMVIKLLEIDLLHLDERIKVITLNRIRLINMSREHMFREQETVFELVTQNVDEERKSKENYYK